jgi:hypothetical protein
MRPYSREMSPASSLQLSQSKSKPANIRVFAATSKACGHCALTACHLCVSGAQRVPPVSCHVPEHGRSVCSSCALQHRSIEVSASRAMFVPSELQVAFAEAFKLSASLDSAMVPMPFRYFYTHLNGNARCFEVFDAVDTSIWKEPLSFTHIFVFPNETLAQTFHSNFAAYLAPLTSLPGFASRVKLSIWYKFKFSLLFAVLHINLCLNLSLQCAVLYVPSARSGQSRSCRSNLGSGAQCLLGLAMSQEQPQSYQEISIAHVSDDGRTQ